MRRALALAAIAVALAGCKGDASKKHPGGAREETASLETTRRAWVGDWEGNGATLHIEPKGYLTFTKSGQSYDGPIDHFEGSDVIVRASSGPMTIEVQIPPHTDDDGKARMTIDGVEVTQRWHTKHPLLDPLKNLPKE